MNWDMGVSGCQVETCLDPVNINFDSRESALLPQNIASQRVHILAQAKNRPAQLFDSSICRVCFASQVAKMIQNYFIRVINHTNIIVLNLII